MFGLVEADGGHARRVAPVDAALVHYQVRVLDAALRREQLEQLLPCYIFRKMLNVQHIFLHHRRVKTLPVRKLVLAVQLRHRFHRIFFELEVDKAKAATLAIPHDDAMAGDAAKPHEQHVQQLRVVDLEQHARDFAGKVRIHELDQREQPLAKHLLLFSRLSSSQHAGGKRLLSNGLSWDRHRLRHLRIAHGLRELVVGRAGLSGGQLRRNRARLHVGRGLLAGDRARRIAHGGRVGLGRLGVRGLLVGAAHVTRLAVLVVGDVGRRHGRVAAGRCIGRHVLVARVRAHLGVGGPAGRGTHRRHLRPVEALRLGDGRHELPLCWYTCPMCCMRRLFTRWMYWLASGLLPTMRPFISVTALVASSGAEKHTKPKPFERPSSSITLAEVIVPYGANSLRSRSSSIVSSSCSNRRFSSIWRSFFFWARPTYSTLPSLSSLPFSFCTASSASSGFSNATKPKPRLLPSFVITRWLVIGPNFSNMSRSASSVRSSPKFFTYTFVNSFAFSPSSFSRSLREMKRPTYTFFSFSSMPLTFSIEVLADSSVSKCTNPYPLLWPFSSCATLQLRMLPNAENVSYIALLSIFLSRFLMNTLPTPDLRSDGSRCDHMMRIGRPLIGSKFIRHEQDGSGTACDVPKHCRRCSKNCSNARQATSAQVGKVRAVEYAVTHWMAFSDGTTSITSDRVVSKLITISPPLSSSSSGASFRTSLLASFPFASGAVLWDATVTQFPFALSIVRGGTHGPARFGAACSFVTLVPWPCSICMRRLSNGLTSIRYGSGPSSVLLETTASDSCL
uniref:Uncharacterized protein n=1 Tax=Anopheles coluzzii TaxID=1518534 RepID=A0A8W7P0C1_ANOCL